MPDHLAHLGPLRSRADIVQDVAIEGGVGRDYLSELPGLLKSWFEEGVECVDLLQEPVEPPP